MEDRTLGAQISHMLKDRGVEVVFGIPGVHNVELYRGIQEAGLRHVLARHEQGAGFMADGYARATGLPGVAYVITGPGLTNIMTPMGQAYSDSVPMLVISSCLDEAAARTGQLHQMRDQCGAGATVCDWSQEARSAEAAYALIDRAFVEFGAKRPRPKHVQVPIALLGATTGPAPDPMLSAERLGDDPAAVEDVLSLLQGARRPLFVLGGGVKSLFGPVDLARFAAASFTTYAGRGLVAEDTPLHFGSWLARPSSAEVIGAADLVIAVGTELSEVDLWRDKLGHQATLVRVDIDPASLADDHRADVQVLTDGHGFLQALSDAATDDFDSDWTQEEVDAARTRWRAETEAEHPGIVAICDALRQVLPKPTMFFSDMTQFAYVAKEVWDMPQPGLWHHPFGFGTLGYALPAAIGGKMGAGARPVVAIAGDYGFQYTLQELGTAVELGLNLPILIWDNAALKEIEDCMVAAQIAPNAVHAGNPDFGLLAQAYGAGYAAPDSVSDLQDAVLEALKRPVPTLIRMRPGLA